MNWKVPSSVSVWIHIWAASWQNQQCGCAPNEDSDQPGHPPSLIRVFAVCMKKAWVLSYPLSALLVLSRGGSYLHCHRISLDEPILEQHGSCIYRWMSIDHVTLLLSDVTGKQTSSLVVETFDWRHVMKMGVERNGRMPNNIFFSQTLHKKLENNA